MQVSVGKVDSLRWKRNRISAGKNFDLSSVADLTSEEGDFYEAGKDIIKKPGCSKIPVLKTGDQEFQDVRKQFDSVFSSLHLSRKERDGLGHFLDNSKF